MTTVASREQRDGTRDRVGVAVTYPSRSNCGCEDGQDEGRAPCPSRSTPSGLVDGDCTGT